MLKCWSIDIVSEYRCLLARHHTECLQLKWKHLFGYFLSWGDRLGGNPKNGKWIVQNYLLFPIEVHSQGRSQAGESIPWYLLFLSFSVANTLLLLPVNIFLSKRSSDTFKIFICSYDHVLNLEEEWWVQFLEHVIKEWKVFGFFLFILSLPYRNWKRGKPFWLQGELFLSSASQLKTEVACFWWS